MNQDQGAVRLVRDRYTAIIKQMHAQNEDLIQQVKNLRREFMPEIFFPETWDLTGTERRILGAMYVAQGCYLRRTALFLIVGEDFCERYAIKRIGVINKKIKHAGIEIVNAEEGYRLSRGAKAIIKGALEAA